MKCVKLHLVVSSGIITPNLITLTIFLYAENQILSSFSLIRRLQLINFLVSMSSSILDSL